MTRFKGAMPPKVDKRDYTYEPSASKIASTEIELPKTLKLNMCEVKNQSNVNSCVAHAMASIEEYFNKIIYEDKTKLSPGYIYGCRYSYKGEGMYLRDALKTAKNGIAEYKEFPYNEEVPSIIDKFESRERWDTPKFNTIATYYSITEEDRIEKMKRALYEHGPLLVSIKWYNDFHLIDGIIRKRTDSIDKDFGYHCVVVYGYNEDGFLIQNSWGDKWGTKGTAVYPYKYDFAEVWGVTDYRTDDRDIKKVETTKFTDILYKIMNFIINLIKEINKD